MGKVKVHSGLQLQVMALYKKVLQAAKRKDIDTLQYVRERFREDVGIADAVFVLLERIVNIRCILLNILYTYIGDNSGPQGFCRDRVYVAQR